MQVRVGALDGSRPGLIYPIKKVPSVVLYDKTLWGILFHFVRVVE